MVPDAVTATVPEPLGTLLRRHAVSAGEPRDAALAEEFLQFATGHADCLLRSCAPGHFTGSAWIVDRERRRTLLTHHRKLDKWLQLGGHADGDPDLLAVALREAAEESGLTRVSAVSGEIFDLDRHLIPARGTEAAHWHYDIRFLVEADPTERLIVTSESKDLSWVVLDKVSELNPEESLLRMVRKTLVG